SRENAYPCDLRLEAVGRGPANKGAYLAEVRHRTRDRGESVPSLSSESVRSQRCVRRQRSRTWVAIELLEIAVEPGPLLQACYRSYKRRMRKSRQPNPRCSRACR